MPLQGDFSKLNLLLGRLAKLPDYQPQMIGEAAPTVRLLLSSGDTQLTPVKGAPWAERRFSVSPQARERISANTEVTVSGRAIHVGTGGGNVHLRPLVPVGELPLKWHAAIAAKINGAIRRHLKGTAQVYGPVERLVQYGPKEKRVKYGPKLPPKEGPRKQRQPKEGGG